MFDAHETVLDIGARAPLRRALFEDHRLLGQRSGQTSGLPIERRGEEQRLPRLRARRHDPLNGRTKAHVEHSIGLIEHQHTDGVKRERAACQQILEPPGSRDEQMRTGGVACLLDQAHATVDGRHP